MTTKGIYYNTIVVLIPTMHYLNRPNINNNISNINNTHLIKKQTQTLETYVIFS